MNSIWSGPGGDWTPINSVFWPRTRPTKLFCKENFNNENCTESDWKQFSINYWEILCLRENSEEWRHQQSQEWLVETKAAVVQQIEDKKRRLQNELRINRLWLQIEQNLQQFQVILITIELTFNISFNWHFSIAKPFNGFARLNKSWKNDVCKSSGPNRIKLRIDSVWPTNKSRKIGNGSPIWRRL